MEDYNEIFLKERALTLSIMPSYISRQDECMKMKDEINFGFEEGTVCAEVACLPAADAVRRRRHCRHPSRRGRGGGRAAAAAAGGLHEEAAGGAAPDRAEVAGDDDQFVAVRTLELLA